MLTTNIILIERINEIYPLVQKLDFFQKNVVLTLLNFEGKRLSFKLLTDWKNGARKTGIRKRVTTPSFLTNHYLFLRPWKKRALKSRKRSNFRL